MTSVDESASSISEKGRESALEMRRIVMETFWRKQEKITTVPRLTPVMSD